MEENQSSPEISEDEKVIEILNADANQDDKNQNLLHRKDQDFLDYDINYKNSNLISRLFFCWSTKAIKLANKKVKIQTKDDYRRISESEEFQYKKYILKTSDVSALSKDQSTRYNIEPLKNSWETYNKNVNSKYPLFKAIFTVHWKLILTVFLIDFTSTILDYVRVYFFNKILHHFSSGDFFPEMKNEYIGESTFWYYYYKIKNYNLNIIESVSFFISIKCIKSFLFSHLEFNNIMLSERITNEMNALLFEKVLTISTAIMVISKGENAVLSRVQVDSEVVGSLFYIGPRIITGPVRIGLSVFWLFKIFGKSFLIGLGILLLLMFIVVIVHPFYKENMENLLKAKDNRIKIITFVFEKLLCIKLNGLDDDFIKRIKIKRNEELLYFKRNLYIHIFRFLINSNLPIILMIICISFYVSKNYSIETSTLFTAFQLISSMTIPIMGIPIFMNQIYNNLASLRRLQSFLVNKDHNVEDFSNKKEMDKGTIIKFDNVTFGINEENKSHLAEKDKNKKEEISDNNSESSGSENDILIEMNGVNNSNNTTTNINKTSNSIDFLKSKLSYKEKIPKKITLLNKISLSVNKGEFIVLFGLTGSGKSCLFQSILNNYSIFSSRSRIIINGVISYSAQQPWIMSGTIRENIVFFNKWDQEKYDKIIKCCKLEEDFKQKEKGDLTNINSTSVGLSGGQKARISLARCLYKDADLYLLDDPLSSVDIKKRESIFKMAFCDYLKDKARILITDKDEISNDPKKINKVLVMDRGEIIFNGTYTDFNQKYVNNNEQSIDNNDNKINEEISNQRNIEEKTIYDDNNENRVRQCLSRRASEDDTINKEQIIKKLYPQDEKNPLQKIDEKAQKDGKVSCDTYREYVRLQGGYIIFLILILVIILSRAINSYRITYITGLSKSYKEINKKVNDENIVSSFSRSFSTYIHISIACVVLNIVSEVIVTWTTVFSLKTLHECIVEKFVHAPIDSFHNLVPIGSILNRLSKDIELVQDIIKTVNFFTKNIFSLVSSIFVCYIYNKGILMISPLIIIFGLIVSSYYNKAATSLTRLHRVSYSPILTIVSEGHRGVDLIRAARVEEKFREKIYKRLDDHFGVHLFIEGTKHWYNLLLRLLSHIIFGSLLLYMAYYKDNYGAKAMAVILQCTEDFILELITTLTHYSSLEVSMISLERCSAVVKYLETEKNPSKQNEERIDSKKFDWPVAGRINFINFSAKYASQENYALKNITLEIKAGEKVGIWGKNGSGKSTIVLSLARILESADKKGQIIIDNIDISKLRLDFLRQNLIIVSQEPFIIDGTIRDNIDPLNKRSVLDMIKVLDELEILNDSNFSSANREQVLDIPAHFLGPGVKQLICFARAILKKNNGKIYVFDEATASLDEKNKNIIKNYIKKNLSGKTIITIAHQLDMVKDCNKIIVIEEGKIIKIGTYNSILATKR